MAEHDDRPRVRSEASTRLWLGLCAAIALSICLYVALVPLAGVAHVTDEVAYTLQAKLFAAGMRTGPPAENPSMLLYPFWVTEPASYAAFPPGWPAVLALGERFGVIWAVNPVLCAIFPILVYGIAREWSDDRTARLAAIIAALSPAIWLLGASRMSHTSVLVAFAASALVVIRKRDGTGYWIAAGGGVAYVVLARPYDAFLIGIPLLCWGMIRATTLRHRAALLSPVVVAVLLVAGDNQALTGEWHTFPIRRWSESWYTSNIGCDRIGIGPGFGCLDTPHTWSNAANLTWDSLRRLDRSLLGFPGGLLAASIGLILLRKRAPWALIAMTVSGYALYWSPGAAYGARFYQPLMLVLPIGIATLVLNLKDRWVPHRPDWGIRILLCSCILAGGSRYLPDLANDYWCVDGSVADITRNAEITEGIILVHSEGQRNERWASFDVEDFQCDPMLVAGTALQLMDPSRTHGGLQVRHTFAEAELRERWLEQEHPGTDAWLYQSDLSTGNRSWQVMEKENDPRGSGGSTMR